MENLGTCSDETGNYCGEMLNGVPNGKGIKSYNFGIKIECCWKKGRKSGIGFFHFGILSLEVKFSKYLPPRLVKLPKLFNIKLPCSFSFDYPVDVIKIEDYYIEKLSAEKKYYSLAIFGKAILCDWYFFSAKIGMLTELVVDSCSIITEIDKRKGSGFKQVKLAGFTKSGVFFDRRLDGFGLLEIKELRYTGYFNKDEPYHYGEFENKIGTLKVFYKDILIKKAISFKNKTGKIYYNIETGDTSSVSIRVSQENLEQQKSDLEVHFDLIIYLKAQIGFLDVCLASINEFKLENIL